MLLDEVAALFKEGKLDEYQFHTYMLFMGSDLGQGYLKNALDSIIMEQPPGIGNFAFSYYGGRISVWREIKAVVIGVHNLLDGKNYDGSIKRDGRE